MSESGIATQDGSLKFLRGEIMPLGHASCTIHVSLRVESLCLVNLMREVRLGFE